MDGEECAVDVYCTKLAVAVEHLARDLVIPLIDWELYSCLFVQPLVGQPSLKAKEASLHDTAVTAATSRRSSTVDRHGDALVALGGTELLVKALRAHEQQTLLVLQAIALRESVMSRIRACCRAYDDSKISVEEAQFIVARLLGDHQAASLLVVESVLEWRQALSRPYPFLLKNGENYLTRIMQDAVALGATALVRSLSRVHLEYDPLSAEVDLHRLLHRLETMHRTRLVNSGAMWRRGLQSLRRITSRRFSNDSPAGGGVGASPARARKAMVASSALCLTSERRRSASATQSYADTSVDFLAEVRRLNAALHRATDRRHGSLPLSFATESPILPPAAVCGTLAATAAQPLFGTSPGGGAWLQQKRQRLLSATRALKEETCLQRRLVEELYYLAHEQEVFVPFLKVAQLFNTDDNTQVSRGVPSDSWPLEKAQWLSFALREERVDRLGCMSTAREVLQSKLLLPAWEHRMGSDTADLAATTSTHPISYTSSTSSPIEGPLTPQPPPVARATPPRTASIERRSSDYSDSFEATDDTGSEVFTQRQERASSPGEYVRPHSTSSSSTF
ncbi:hypothetical protein JKF63_02624 [Porcisia hertigi]|uniref:Uncharacterized protein n=1 Tax=Porcisia hertigi TaxID=2761500 RepID=A0A836I1A7_9TRYP|nr:hypothetical protein JKF63_02624 [Porcisia hertigi]